MTLWVGLISIVYLAAIVKCCGGLGVQMRTLNIQTSFDPDREWRIPGTHERRAHIDVGMRG